MDDEGFQIQSLVLINELLIFNKFGYHHTLTLPADVYGKPRPYRTWTWYIPVMGRKLTESRSNMLGGFFSSLPVYFRYERPTSDRSRGFRPTSKPEFAFI